MKVILLQTNEQLGQIGDIVNVKAGYARNYLIPQKIASIATKKNITVFHSKKIRNFSNYYQSFFLHHNTQS